MKPGCIAHHDSGGNIHYNKKMINAAHRKYRIALLLAISIALFLAPAGWGWELMTEERAKVSVAVGPDDVFHGYIQLAAAMGLISRHGLDLQLTVMSSGARAAEAVIQGRSVFGIHGFEQVLLARQREIPLIAIGKAANGPGLQIVARERSLAKTWASPRLRGSKKFSLLKGRLIGVDAGDLLQRAWIHWMSDKAGLNIQTDLKVINVGARDAGMAAMEAGRVDLLVSRPPTGEIIQSKGAGRIVWPSGKEIGDALYLVVSMREEDAREVYPETPGKFLWALRLAFILLRQQQDYTLSIARRLWPRVPEDALKLAVANTLHLLPRDDLMLKKNEARLTIGWLLKAGGLNRKIPFEASCTNQFLR